MTKSQKFLSVVSKLQINPPENMDEIISWIDSNQKITFFNWKMFNIKIKNSILLCDYNFDTKSADKLVDKEKLFLNILVDLKINFEYLKIIPNELSKYFFNKSDKIEEIKFAQQVNTYFRKIYIPTQTFLLTDLLKENNLASVYQSIFTSVYKNTGKLVNQEEMAKEILFRTTYYSSKPLELKFSQELAKRAFGLFAAETAIIFKRFNNPVLLTSSKSVNTYKYEFFKYPKTRPVLPKLFVI